MDNGQTYTAGSKHEYFYDDNGNMTADYNKGITSISYNHLNLPVEIDLGSKKEVNYIYDPMGTKLRKENFDYSQQVGLTDYCGEFVYTNNKLDYILFEEGRIVKDGANYNFEYHLTDHLGNVRVTFEDDGTGTATITQSQDYYPFGLTFNQSSTSSDNKYLYNGKEIQDETQLIDFGARFYDNQLSRWHNIDELADNTNQVDKSPYAAMWNNPVLFNDPDGRCPNCIIGGVVSAAIDLGLQVTMNKLAGKDAFENIDGKSIAISFAGGVASGGVATLTKAKKLKQVLDVGVDALESVADQKITQGDVSLTETIIDVTAGKIGDHVKVDAPINTKNMENWANRAERVAKNDPSSSGRAQKAENARAKVNRANNYNTTVTTASAKAPSQTIKTVKEQVETDLQNNQYSRYNVTPKINQPDANYHHVYRYNYTIKKKR